MSSAVYSIAELAELGGVSRRTVRYYVQRGLIPAPLGTGRGKHYGQEHLDQLVRVRVAQERGVPLVELVEGSAESSAASAVPAPAVSRQAWLRMVMADGVELHIRSGLLEPEDVAALQDALRDVLNRKMRPQPHSQGELP
jgi:DNA-binding transcriptional MerR regulator